MFTSKFKIILILTIAVLATGCTAVISPHVSESEFLSSAIKNPGKVQLFVTDEFRTHKESQTEAMDLKSWEYDLGPMAVDTFKYALGSRFYSVEVKLGKPTFPIVENGQNEIVIAVEPSFAGFDAHFPWVFKFETYVAEVTFHVKAYNKNGSQILNKTYQGKGEQRGSIGYESAGHAANPIASQLAVKDAVNQAVEDILKAIK